MTGKWKLPFVLRLILSGLITQHFESFSWMIITHVYNMFCWFDACWCQCPQIASQFLWCIFPLSRGKSRFAIAFTRSTTSARLGRCGWRLGSTGRCRSTCGSSVPHHWPDIWASSCCRGLEESGRGSGIEQKHPSWRFEIVVATSRCILGRFTCSVWQRCIAYTCI